jgi:hypothetical protein
LPSQNYVGQIKKKLKMGLIIDLMMKERKFRAGDVMKKKDGAVSG